MLPGPSCANTAKSWSSPSPAPRKSNTWAWNGSQWLAAAPTCGTDFVFRLHNAYQQHETSAKLHRHPCSYSDEQRLNHVTSPDTASWMRLTNFGRSFLLRDSTCMIFERFSLSLRFAAVRRGNEVASEHEGRSVPHKTSRNGTVARRSERASCIQRKSAS